MRISLQQARAFRRGLRLSPDGVRHVPGKNRKPPANLAGRNRVMTLAMPFIKSRHPDDVITMRSYPTGTPYIQVTPRGLTAPHTYTFSPDTGKIHCNMHVDEALTEALAKYLQQKS